MLSILKIDLAKKKKKVIQKNLIKIALSSRVGAGLRVRVLAKDIAREKMG